MNSAFYQGTLWGAWVIPVEAISGQPQKETPVYKLADKRLLVISNSKMLREQTWAFLFLVVVVQHVLKCSQNFSFFFRHSRCRCTRRSSCRFHRAQLQTGMVNFYLFGSSWLCFYRPSWAEKPISNRKSKRQKFNLNATLCGLSNNVAASLHIINVKVNPRMS